MGFAQLQVGKYGRTKVGVRERQSMNQCSLMAAIEQPEESPGCSFSPKCWSWTWFSVANTIDGSRISLNKGRMRLSWLRWLPVCTRSKQATPHVLRMCGTLYVRWMVNRVQIQHPRKKKKQCTRCGGARISLKSIGARKVFHRRDLIARTSPP